MFCLFLFRKSICVFEYYLLFALHSLPRKSESKTQIDRLVSNIYMLHTFASQFFDFQNNNEERRINRPFTTKVCAELNELSRHSGATAFHSGLVVSSSFHKLRENNMTTRKEPHSQNGTIATTTHLIERGDTNIHIRMHKKKYIKPTWKQQHKMQLVRRPLTGNEAKAPRMCSGTGIESVWLRKFVDGRGAEAVWIGWDGRSLIGVDSWSATAPHHDTFVVRPTSVCVEWKGQRSAKCLQTPMLGNFSIFCSYFKNTQSRCIRVICLVFT